MWVWFLLLLFVTCESLHLSTVSIVHLDPPVNDLNDILWFFENYDDSDFISDLHLPEGTTEPLGTFHNLTLLNVSVASLLTYSDVSYFNLTKDESIESGFLKNKYEELRCVDSSITSCAIASQVEGEMLALTVTATINITAETFPASIDNFMYPDPFGNYINGTELSSTYHNSEVDFLNLNVTFHTEPTEWTDFNSAILGIKNASNLLFPQVVASLDEELGLESDTTIELDLCPLNANAKSCNVDSGLCDCIWGYLGYKCENVRECLCTSKL